MKKNIQLLPIFLIIFMPLKGLAGEPLINFQDSTIIRGIVSDKTGNPLIDAEVSWNGQTVSKTTVDGRFEFTIPSLQPATINISYPHMNPVVRTYHPSMGNVEYVINLCPPGKCRIKIICNLDTILFKYIDKSIELSDDHKSMLETFADKLRNNPGLHVALTSGGQTPPEIRRANYKLSSVKNWLVDKEGISEERIIINENLSNPNLLKSVEIKTYIKE